MPAQDPKLPARHLRASDLRAIARLVTQAITGVTRVVEGVHQSVWSTLGAPGGKMPGETRGLTGLVYRSIVGVTQGVGNGLDAVLTALQPWLEAGDDARIRSPQSEAAIAALNGVLGDHLRASGNPFATPMSLRYRGTALDWRSMPAMPDATSKVLVLVHGLCMNDLQWRAEHDGGTVDHGEALAAALGYTPIYLRYNSGLHVSQNGNELAAELEHLTAHWPVPIEEISVVAHSMGGLLARSAVHTARETNRQWPSRLRHLVFLGTPHHGAPLERAGNRLDDMLGSTRYTAPLASLGQLRSAGITDLRYGHVLDQDWEGHDRFRRQPDARRIVPLPAGVACHAMAACTAAARSPLADRLIGDGLVPLHSALGRHGDVGRSLAFPKSSQSIAYRMNHMQLLSDPRVTRQLLHWLTPTANYG